MTARFPGSYSGFAENRGDVRMPYSHRPFVAVGTDRLFYGSGSSFELRELDASFALRRVIRWPSLRTQLAGSEVSRARTEWLAARERGDPLFRQLADVMFAPELLPAERPAIGKALIADDGRIWVARFEPFGFVETLWYVLEPNGVPVAKLRIPMEKKALLTAVRGDRVLLITRDELDVPQIEVIHILR